MGDFLKKIFRFRTLLTVFSIFSGAGLLLSYLSAFLHPSSFKFIPLFGLTYWIILVVNVLFIILWVLLKSRWAIIVLSGIILIGGTIHFRTFSFGWDEENIDQSTELNVLSYNVRLFDLYNPSIAESLKTRSSIFNYLKKENADVYCFQEFYNQQPPTDFKTKDTLTTLLQAPYTHTRFSLKDRRRQEFGVAIFSKHKIIQQGEVSFSEVKRTNNYCIFVDIVKAQDTFRVYNVHFQSIKLQQDDYALFNEENPQSAEEDSRWYKLVSKIVDAYPVRAKQAEKVAEHMETSPYPVIVCGDFNDTPMSYTYNQFNKTLTDAFRNTSKGMGTTYAGKIPAGRIDFIFHSQSLGSRNFAIQKEKLSDHYAISCTLFKH